MKNRIKELRKNIFHMNQREFAKLLEISQGSLSGIEKGERQLPMDALKKLAYLSLENSKIDILWLLTGTYSYEIYSDIEITHDYMNLDKRGKNLIEMIIQYELNNGNVE